MTIRTNGKQIHHISKGAGQPVILIHGMAASLRDWDSLIPELADSGCSAHALDLLGHGESAKPEETDPYHIESIYEHLQTWIDGLNLDRPAVLVGHSLGGYLSLLYALRQSEKVRSLVLIDPLYSPDQLSPLIRLLRQKPEIGRIAFGAAPEWAIQLAIGLDPTARTNFTPEVRKQIAADYRRASPNIVYLTRNFPDLTPELGRVALPTLVIWGKKDLTLRPESFGRLSEALPNAASACIPECGHQPHIGVPEQLNRLVLDFILKVGPQDNNELRKKRNHFVSF